MKFKKISAVLGAVFLASASIASGLVAGTYSDTIAAGSNYAVVYGTGEGVSDLDEQYAQNIDADLKSKVSTGGDTVVSGGDSFQFERASDAFNLGENITTFYATVDEGELSNVLAQGEYLNDENDDFEYDQTLTLQDLTLTHFQNDDYSDEPAIGFNLADNTVILNYTLDFTPDAVTSTGDWDDLEQSNIEILGKEYYISEATNTSDGSEKLTLLDSANSAIISEGETQTISAGGESYEVGISFIDDTDVMLIVDGTTTNKLGEGDVYEVSSDVFVAVKNNLYSAKDTGVSQAEVSIGSGEMVLENGQEVTINDEDVDGLTVAITGDETLEEIRLDWVLSDDSFIAEDSELVLPGFENIKFLMGDFVTAEKETIKVESDNDAVKLTVPLEDGETSFDILYGNGTVFNGTGEDSTDLLLTTNESYVNITDVTKQQFIASWTDGTAVESYLLEVSNIDDSDPDKNTTTIRSVTDTSNAINVDVGEYDDIGRIRFTVGAANEENDTANNITVSAVSSGNVSLNKVYTEEGLTINLPWEFDAVNYTDTPAPAYAVESNASAEGYTSQTSYVLQLKEENEDGDIDSGEAFNITLGWDSNEEEPEVTGSVSADSGDEHETDDGSDKYELYVESPLATKIIRDASGDITDAEITYNGEEAYASVYIAEEGVTAGADLGNRLYKDTEQSSWENSNVVIVGGSCINSAAAEALGVSAGTCGDAFTDATGVESGQFLIDTVEDAFASGKTALVVAGYNAQDTVKAAQTVINEGAEDGVYETVTGEVVVAA